MHKRVALLTAAAAMILSFSAAAQTWEIHESSGRQGTNVPVTLSFFGVPGDFTGQNIHPVVNGVSKRAQVDVRSTWPDGSICHALITFTMDVAAGATYNVDFVGTRFWPQNNRFRAKQGITYPLQFTAEFREENGAYSEVDFTRTQAYLLLRNANWNGGFARSGAFGPLLREYEWRFRPTSSNGTPHADIEVVARWRLYHNQPTAFVELIVENCRTDVTPHDLEYDDFRLTLGRRSRVHLTDRRHLVQTRFMDEAWVGNAPPELRILPDLDYLARIGLVPPLDPARRVTANQATTYINRLMNNNQRGNVDLNTPLGLPLDHGPIYKYQPGTGDRQDIGWFPEWTLLALNGASEPAWRFTFAGDGNGSGAFPVHNRNMSTGEMSIPHWHSYWQNKLRHQPQFRNSKIPNTAHMPMVGMAAFILTGRKTFFEELACWTQFGVRDWYPNAGRLKAMGDRKSAWALRNLALTYRLAPDDHPLKTYWFDRLEATANHWASNLDTSMPLGTYGPGGWRSSGRSSWPCGMRVSPWQNSWFAGMNWVAYKMQGNPAFLDMLTHNWEYYRSGYLTTDTWTAPNGETVVADPAQLMQYSKCASIYTPTVVNNKWSVEPGTVVPLTNWAATQWYERIQRDFPVRSASDPSWPAAGPAPQNWRPAGGSYSPPPANRYDEYGPARVALFWMAGREGLPQAGPVTNVVQPWIQNQRQGKNSQNAPGVQLLIRWTGQ